MQITTQIPKLFSFVISLIKIIPYLSCIYSAAHSKRVSTKVTWDVWANKFMELATAGASKIITEEASWKDIRQVSIQVFG